MLNKLLQASTVLPDICVINYHLLFTISSFFITYEPNMTV